MKSTKFRLAELFCGPGGLSLGLSKATAQKGSYSYSITPVWANDIDQDSCKTYALNLHDGNAKNVICSPVEKLDFRAIPKFDVLAFGFPCNDFSVVGEQKGIRGKFGPLYTYGVKALDIHQPKWFIAENVSGLQSANEGATFQQILSDLEGTGSGYELTTHLYKFEEYGVPQTRHRIVIVGIRKDLGLKFRVPAPTTADRHVPVSKVLQDLSIDTDIANNEITAQSEMVVERLKHIPPGENAWFKGLPKHLQLNVKTARMSQIYRRLHPEKPSYTITGSGGGGTHGYHWEENRALTNRERARIQTFPDDFVFVGSKESVRKQIGMAVPVIGAQAIAEAVLKTFAGLEYDWVPAKFANGEPGINSQQKLFTKYTEAVQRLEPAG